MSPLLSISAIVAASLFGAATTKAAPASAWSVPHLGADYGKPVAGWPDFTGAWSNSMGDSRLLFDAQHPYLEPDPAGKAGGLDFGFLGGSYDKDIPLKPEAMKLYRERIAKAREGAATDPIGQGCRPYGMPRVMGGNPGGPQFIYAPQLIIILFEDDVRRIYMDGRGHPDSDHAVSTFEGHSVGHWEGDVLIVDTTQIFEGNYDQSDAPHSDQTRVVERIRMTGPNTLEDELTVTDPMMLTRPWVVTRTYSRSSIRLPNRANTNCTPESQVQLVNGSQVMTLPSER